MKKIISISLVTAVSLMAASPTTGDILKQVKPIKVEKVEKVLPTIDDSEYKEPLLVDDTAKILVKSFVFSGNTVFSSDVLSKLVESSTNKELGINGIKVVASLVTKYYRDNGYFVARAYIPKQNIENGEVEIAIIEGVYGDTNFDNSSLVNTENIQGYMNYLKSGQVISTSTLERQMLVINDLTGVKITNVEVMPGGKIGTSDFKLSVGSTPKYTGYAVLDNYGSVYTGKSRLSLGTTINSVSGIGDSIDINGMISNTQNLKNIRVGYNRPIGYDGLNAGISYSKTNYEIDKIPSYTSYGTTDTINTFVSYPIIKTKTHTLNTTLSFEHRAMKDTSGATSSEEESKKNIDALTLTLNDLRNTNIGTLPGFLNISAGITYGNVDLKNELARTQDQLLESEGGYSKVTLNLEHTQYLIENLNLKSTFKGQKSINKNLDSSEDISLAGSNGVRAYEDSELSGDKGYGVSFDFIYTLPKIEKLSHNVSLFIDHARAWTNENTFNTDDNTRTINAVGIGYGLSYDMFNLKASFARGFGSDSTPTSEAEFSTSKNKFLVQGMMQF